MHRQTTRRPHWSPSQRTARAAMILSALMLPATAPAATFTWDGQYNSQWDYSIFDLMTFTFKTNWSPDGSLTIDLPTASDNVAFAGEVPNDNIVNLGGTRPVNHATVNAGPDFSLENGLLSPALDLTINTSGGVALSSTSGVSAGRNLVLDGGRLSSFSGSIYVGDTASPGILTGDLEISDSNAGGLNGGRMTIFNGGDLFHNADGYIGYDPGDYGYAEVTGAGSTWTNNGFLVVGFSGNGTLLVQAGGTVSNATGFIGDRTGSTGTATVNGADSVWTNSTNLFVGSEGNGTLNVEAGGAVLNNTGFIGYSTGSTGTATINGADSVWTNSTDLVVGRQGNGTLNVEAGGAVLNNTGFIGEVTGSTGTATINGADSVWTNSTDLVVGRQGNGTLKVEAGGAVLNNTGFIGEVTGSTGTATVTGIDSTWQNSGGGLRIGVNGTGTLMVSAGGAVESTLSTLGTFAGASGSATVTGASSTWTHTGNLEVGTFGSGDLTVMNGGLVTSDNGLIGHHAGSTGTVNVTGAGSIWSNSASLYVGGSSSSAGGVGTLSLLDSGLVQVAGSMRVWGTGTVLLDGGLIDAATIDHTLGGTFNFTDGTLSVDSFLGTLDQNGGTLSPGNSPGVTTISGDYNLNAGSLKIELGGLSAGTAFDVVDVAGALNLGGMLEVKLINWYFPAVGDSFDILNWGSLTGNFATIKLPTLNGSDIVWDTSNLLVDGTLSVVSNAIEGDLNSDGFVGIDDLNIVLGNWNLFVPPANLLADPSGDGFVGIDDLNAVLGNWNAGTPPTTSNTIPEPATLCLLVSGLVLICRGRDRRDTRTA